MATKQVRLKPLHQVAHMTGRYPVEAFDFVRHGLQYCVQQVHPDAEKLQPGERHITGQTLCSGLRDYAVALYGHMAQAVLNHWRIFRTDDFGRIVFAMIEHGYMQKTDADQIQDFVNVFAFSAAFATVGRSAGTDAVAVPAREPVFRM